ncbi:TIGR01777 family protein [Verrucomicrobia bacterium LW23]|nr:TIGR01777 family protein [Verrucomicrobia bacterium LW23]
MIKPDNPAFIEKESAPGHGTVLPALPHQRIVIPGGNGDLGAILARHLHDAGHHVVVFSRRPSVTPWKTKRWDGSFSEDLLREIDGADAVINLAGRSVNCRYGASNRREILVSRTVTTEAVGQAIFRAERPPRVWLQASSATLYAHRYDAPNDEATGRIGDNSSAPARSDATREGHPAWRFSVDVVQAWERAATESPGAQRTRLVLMRVAMVMATAGGAFPVLRSLARLGLGGAIGDGRQYVSWIHELDFVRAVDFLLARHEIAGPVNFASPNPLPNRDFMQHLRVAQRVPFGLPTPEFLLEAGAFFMRTESELVLKSRRVVPGRLLQAGFTFRYPTWPEAASELCTRLRQG